MFKADLVVCLVAGALAQSSFAEPKGPADSGMRGDPVERFERPERHDPADRPERPERHDRPERDSHKQKPSDVSAVVERSPNTIATSDKSNSQTDLSPWLTTSLDTKMNCTESGTALSLVPHSPFVSTPLGSKMSNVSCERQFSTTGNNHNPLAGEFGFVRTNTDGSPKYHGGVDLSPNNENEFSIYSINPFEGNATATVRDTETNGKLVELTYIDESGVWKSTTMHHSEALVKSGDTVNPGQKVAVGIGEGSIFNDPLASEPHVHWKTELNGKRFDPKNAIEASAEAKRTRQDIYDNGFSSFDTYSNRRKNFKTCLPKRVEE